MAGITLAQAETALANSITAYTNACTAQAASRGAMSHTNADLEKLQKAIDYWDAKVKALSANATGGMKVFSGVAVDN